MTRVRITVDDQLLGDIAVEQDDRVTSYSAESQREAIGTLLRLATLQIVRAYQLPDGAVR